MSPVDHVPENAQIALSQWGQVVRGHDAVHPNRDACGGIGGCALMRAEHDAEEEAIELLRRLARRNLPYVLRVKP